MAPGRPCTVGQASHCRTPGGVILPHHLGSGHPEQCAVSMAIGLPRTIHGALRRIKPCDMGTWRKHRAKIGFGLG